MQITGEPLPRPGLLQPERDDGFGVHAGSATGCGRAIFFCGFGFVSVMEASGSLRSARGSRRRSVQADGDGKGFGAGASGRSSGRRTGAGRGRRRRRAGLSRADWGPLGKHPDLEAIVARQRLHLPLSGRLSEPQVNRAWKVAAAEHHPDRGGAHATMQAINAARDLLLGRNAD